MPLQDPDIQTNVQLPADANGQEQSTTLTVPGATSQAAVGLDNTQLEQGTSGSIMNTIDNIVTKGVPLTALSVVNSFYNTGVELDNWLGGSSQKLSVADEVSDPDILDYYNQHSQGIEAAGLIAGSLIPGTAAIKAVRLMRAGEVSSALADSTGLLRPEATAKVIQQGLDDINAGSDGVFGGLQASKYQAIAQGFGDQALEGLAFQTATYATMHASPLLDQQSYGDVADNMFFGTLLAGGVGGLLEGIGTNAVFNKALAAASVKSKSYEVLNQLGNLNVETGDKISTLLDSLDTVNSVGPVPSGLSSIQRGLANTQADLQGKNLSKQLANGDEDVGSAFWGAIKNLHASANGDRGQVFNKLARLNSITRLDGSPQTVDGTSFYVNNILQNNKNYSIANPPSLSDLVTQPILDDAGNIIQPAAPNAFANFSRRFILNDPTQPPSIAFYNDILPKEIDDPPLYKSGADAWKDGHDIFIKGNQIYVNPKAPNITEVPHVGLNRILSQKEAKAFAATGQLPADAKPLIGTEPTIELPYGKAPNGLPTPLTQARPLASILNTKNLKVTDSAIPVVGDLGAPRLIANKSTLQVGDKLISYTGDITKGTATEANAQYVSAMLGKKYSGNNIPEFEALYHAAKVNPEILNGTEYAEGGLEDIVDELHSQKIETADQLMEDNPNMSSEEVAMRINSPEEFLQNMFHSTEPEDFTIDPAQHMNVNHVKLAYNIGNTSIQDGQILKGLQDVAYRIQIAEDAATTQLTRFLTASGSNISADSFISSNSAADTDFRGAGASFFGSANSDYGTLGQSMQRIGQLTTKLSGDRLGKIQSTLIPIANALRNNPEDAAKLGMFVTIRRSTGAAFKFLPDNIAASSFGAKLQPGDRVAVLADSLSQAKDGTTVWDNTYRPEGYSLQQTHFVLPKNVADWEDANRIINNGRVQLRNGWFQAQGLNKEFPLDTLYAPPVDTSKEKYFAYVKPKTDVAMSDGEPSIIVARDAASLAQKISLIDHDHYSVFTKADLANYHKAQGEYDFGRNFSNTNSSRMLQRKGILNDLMPETRADTLIEQYRNWHSNQELGLVRDHVELANAQLFSTIKAMGEKFANTNTSTVGPLNFLKQSTVRNPYKEYINTALAIGNKENYTPWQYAQEKLTQFGDAAFAAVQKASGAARRNVIPYEQVGKIASEYGLGSPYGDGVKAIQNYYEVANKLPPSDILRKIVSIGNTVLGNGIIRFDAFQQLIHVLATPVMLNAEYQSLVKAGNPIANLAIPGTQKLIPNMIKLIAGAIGHFFDGDYVKQTAPLFHTIGVDNEIIAQRNAVLNQLSLPYGSKISKITDWAGHALDKIPVLGTNWTQKFIHFIVADVGKQIFEAAGQSGKELEANLMTFANRVQGNYVASQRPIAFQGPLGSAISLFQTYQFNLAQQLFRYIGDGDVKAIATAAVLQNSIFGLQSIPGFQLINNHIIGNAAGNVSHTDLYDTANNFFGHQLANWILYGGLSNVTNFGLYQRGDLNPRQATVLPLNPMQFPAISGAVKFASAIYDTASKIEQGGSIPASLLLGLEHNGLSRPLAGLAEMVQGFSTTSSGQLIANQNPLSGDNSGGWSELQQAANFGRLLGARPLDEAISLDAMYRTSVYQAKNRASIESLGETVKTTLYANQQPSPDQVNEFASEYAAHGGDIGKFDSMMLKWANQANASVANKVFNNLNNPIAQNAQVQMGGRLPDFVDSYAPPPASTEPQQQPQDQTGGVQDPGY